MDTKHEALELAEHLEQFRSFPKDQEAAALLRRQHARIEELEWVLKGAISSLYDKSAGGSFGTYDSEILEEARALLTKKD